MANAIALPIAGAAPANGPHQIVVSEGLADAPNAERWDYFVAAMPGGDLVQTSAWAEAKRALGFESCRVVVQAGEAIVGGGQIIIKRFGPLGALGYVARGPLLCGACPEQAAAVLTEIERVARARRVRHLIVQPPDGGDCVVAALAARGYAPDAPAVSPSATLRIDLSQSLDQILARMSTSKRSRIRRSQRAGLDIRIGGRRDLDLFHALHEATARRQGFTGLSRSYLHHHWDALSARRSVQLLFVYQEGRPLSATLLTPFGDTVTDRLSGWAGEGRHLHPNVARVWGAIHWAKQQGYRYYDLGGVDRRYAELILAGQPLPEEFHRTPAAFKRELGAEAVLLPTASQYTFHPLARPIVGTLYPKLARRKSLRLLINRFRNG